MWSTSVTTAKSKQPTTLATLAEKRQSVKIVVCQTNIWEIEPRQNSNANALRRHIFEI
jgi:hypothetical protein